MGKCGIAEFIDVNDEDDDKYDYSLIGEGVAPWFDYTYRDFRAIIEAELKKSATDTKILQQLGEFLDEMSNEFFAEFYEDGDQKETRGNKQA
jgi:hypothetical protein